MNLEEKFLLLGDEAIALGAIHAGISGVYAYPGTPSTEITEYIQGSKLGSDIYSNWCSNEKTAMEAALGMSYVGKRALVCMKHVGMNVCADAFINSAVSGINGGVVVLAADDPSMHSSQNEQDSRFYGKFAMIPILEPSSQQEAYDMMSYAFELSESLMAPVLFRITTRMAHSRAVVVAGAAKAQNTIHYPEDPKRWVLLPATARRRYNEVIAQQSDLQKLSQESKYNLYHEGSDKSLGVIASGIAWNYLNENFPDGLPYSAVKISQYPLPVEMIARLVGECDR
ncbi:MAG: indolepyruvate ferredoxin oxidoreductase, partial [Rikenellaceae bacterium]